MAGLVFLYHFVLQIPCSSHTDALSLNCALFHFWGLTHIIPFSQKRPHLHLSGSGILLLIQVLVQTLLPLPVLIHPSDLE